MVVAVHNELPLVCKNSNRYLLVCCLGGEIAMEKVPNLVSSGVYIVIFVDGCVAKSTFNQISVHQPLS
jgi:hypothetical protein